MPGYSFQPQFVDPILTGKKGGTIRLPRRIPARWGRDRHHIAAACGNHARAGDTLHLWCKLRTPQAFKIGERTCIGTEPIHLFFEAGGKETRPSVVLANRSMIITDKNHLDAFAVFDGFDDWLALNLFWRSAHGAGLSDFKGWHIRWLDLPPAIIGAAA
jgi:hypothetical protein